ncbi:GAF domain-containing protein [bacterium]|nr:GAF domain-containing protein [bacterium]
MNQKGKTFHPKRRYSDHPPIDRLIASIVHELRTFTEEQARNISDLAEIGKAMSAERNLSHILELILSQARRFTRADAGTLYLLTEDRRELAFYVLHNDTLNTYMGGTSNQKVTLPNVLLYTNEQPNHSNVSAFVALTNKTVNISDAYKEEGFNFEGTKTFDKITGYRSQSMLVVPMCDHENEMIGVLQLINSKNTEGESIPFSSDVMDLTEALASQAAVMLTQQNLIKNLKDLFESFIKAIATAIEKKSNYTGGHIQRVTELTMKIAEKINQTKKGPFSETCFSQDEMEELRIAAWMHDTGKITTSNHIVDKSMKLEGIFNRIELIKTRWETISLSKQLAAEQEKARLKQKKADHHKIEQIDQQCQTELSELADEFAFLEKINHGGEEMSEAKIARLNQIAAKTFQFGQRITRYLTDNEVENLSIRKGTLTKDERDIMESHAEMTIKILESLPWPRKLKNVPRIAGAHHERLDGTGYPMKYGAAEINLQSRIMAVSDIFEALSAPDRPYKKPMSVSEAIKILKSLIKENHIDRDIVELLLDSGLINEYAIRYLKKEQIDL